MGQMDRSHLNPPLPDAFDHFSLLTIRQSFPAVEELVSRFRSPAELCVLRIIIRLSTILINVSQESPVVPGDSAGQVRVSGIRVREMQDMDTPFLPGKQIKAAFPFSHRHLDILYLFKLRNQEPAP